MNKAVTLAIIHVMEDICIFTPTYNRAYMLEALFESLKAQTSQRFYWLIVDDGSTDETRSLVERFSSESSFRVVYVKRENGGKQRAHNTGVECCESELFFCVDSDDVLVPCAVEVILDAWEVYRANTSVAGLVGLCGRDENTPLGTRMPQGERTITFWDLYYKKGHRGDSALVYRTEILRRYPFFVAEGEKFMAEPYVYHQIDLEYTLGVVDSVFIVREYLEDGYTHNVREITKRNPIGYRILKRMYIEYSDTLYLKFYNSILYLVGCKLSGMKSGVKNAPNPIIAAFAYLPAVLLCKTVYR
ncbi:glycosyltransferase family 2 protein [Paraeggerthella sp. Marseille-Q4926]|uniref:glycosyltransferase family 2 protein n=1 Tax=Paraeggerthella sp. Marseille-Q4926 TaxID=2866587 RepID=UPI001CE3C5FA|nr:glycosyltransferase family 2 protein [Paraeggerthella sp. Marseille-Q4926]